MPLAGISTPYLYIGGYGTIFAWHTEDLDMSSINYLHHGATKLWYVIAPPDAKRFQACLKSKYPEAFLECPQYFRHKTIVANPYVLQQAIPGIRIHKILQNQNEFVVTFGSAYHQGFNFGFNVAESVNFATPSWLPNFPKFTYCRCHKDNLRIDPQSFCDTLLKSELTREGVPPDARAASVPRLSPGQGGPSQKDPEDQEGPRVGLGVADQGRGPHPRRPQGGQPASPLSLPRGGPLALRAASAGSQIVLN